MSYRADRRRDPTPNDTFGGPQAPSTTPKTFPLLNLRRRAELSILLFLGLRLVLGQLQHNCSCR